MNKTHLTSMLQVHPARRALPSFSNPATVASIGEIGVIQPLIVTDGCESSYTFSAPGYRYVVDGVDRLNGAIARMVEEVPIIVIPQDMVQATLLHSLLARKHLTKSALAFVAFPMLEPSLEESRTRRLACLKKGGSDASPSKSTVVVSNDYGPKTIEEIAQLLGVGRDMLFKARNVHGFLKKVSAEKRAEIETAILAGTMDLTAAIHSLSGHDSTAGKDRNTPGQLELFDRDFKSLSGRWQKWHSIPEPQRNVVAQKFAAQVEEWPEEVLKAVIARLQEGVSK